MAAECDDEEMIAPLPQPTHAGGVVFRQRNGEPQFLLITARRQPHEWVYPKGHIERLETPEQAALREVHEESGVNAEIVAPLEDVRIRVAGEAQIIRYFLMRADGDGSPGEGRRLLWAFASEALQLLSFAETRSTLDKALQMMRERNLV